MHNHGFEYRVRITAQDNVTEYSGWFNTEDELRGAMRRTARDPKKAYHCERRSVRCAHACCDVDQTIETISTL